MWNSTNPTKKKIFFFTKTQVQPFSLVAVSWQGLVKQIYCVIGVYSSKPNNQSCCLVWADVWTCFQHFHGSLAFMASQHDVRYSEYVFIWRLKLLTRSPFTRQLRISSKTVIGTKWKQGQSLGLLLNVRKTTTTKWLFAACCTAAFTKRGQPCAACTPRGVSLIFINYVLNNRMSSVLHVMQSVTVNNFQQKAEWTDHTLFSSHSAHFWTSILCILLMENQTVTQWSSQSCCKSEGGKGNNPACRHIWGWRESQLDLFSANGCFLTGCISFCSCRDTWKLMLLSVVESESFCPAGLLAFINHLLSWLENRSEQE